MRAKDFIKEATSDGEFYWPNVNYPGSLTIRLLFTEFVKTGGNVYDPIKQESNYKSAVEVFLEDDKDKLIKAYPALLDETDFEDIPDLADEITQYAQAKLMEQSNG